MVLADDLERLRRNGAGALENLYAHGHVAFHDLVFALVELAGFVQDGIGHPHLADVVQERPHAEQIELFFLQAQMAPKGQREDAHAKTMKRGVVIAFFQLGEANQGIRIAKHARGHGGHHFLGARGVDALAEVHVVHNRVDERSSLVMGLANDLGFLLDVGPICAHPPRPGCGGLLGNDVKTGCSLRLRRPSLGGAAGRWLRGAGAALVRIVDVDVPTVLLEVGQLRIVGDFKALKEKQRLTPWAIQRTDVHALF